MFPVVSTLLSIMSFSDWFLFAMLRFEISLLLVFCRFYHRICNNMVNCCRVVAPPELSRGVLVGCLSFGKRLLIVSWRKWGRNFHFWHRQETKDNKLEIFLRKMSCIAERALSIALIIEAVYKEFNFPYEMIGPRWIHKIAFVNKLRRFLQNLLNIIVIRGKSSKFFLS